MRQGRNEAAPSPPRVFADRLSTVGSLSRAPARIVIPRGATDVRYHFTSETASRTSAASTLFFLLFLPFSSFPLPFFPTFPPPAPHLPRSSPRDADTTARGFYPFCLLFCSPLVTDNFHGMFPVRFLRFSSNVFFRSSLRKRIFSMCIYSLFEVMCFFSPTVNYAVARIYNFIFSLKRCV